MNLINRNAIINNDSMWNHDEEIFLRFKKQMNILKHSKLSKKTRKLC